MKATDQVNITTAFPLINAVINKLQEGYIFNPAGDDHSFYIFHKAGFSYLTKAGEPDYSEILNFLLLSDKIPVYFHVYDAPLRLISLCEKENDRVNIRIRTRVQLKFQGSQLKNDDFLLPENYQIKQIDEGNFNALSVFNLNLESKFWQSKQDFIKNGFGFCVFDEDNLPASICYSACVANAVAEIDVATLPEHQKKGLAKKVVVKFVDHCLKNNMVANWDCFEENHSSLRTAQSVGFKTVRAYDFLSIFNKAKSA